MSGDLPLADPPRPDGGKARAGEATRTLLDQPFDADSLYQLRAAVVAHAAEAGLTDPRAMDVMLAVHELAANAVRHGAGAGRLLMQVHGGALRCIVQDGAGPGQDGRQAAADTGPWAFRENHGLWIVRELAREMTVVHWPGGSQVTAVFYPDITRTPPGGRA